MNFIQYFDETNYHFFNWNVKSVSGNCLIIPKWHPSFVLMASRCINNCLRGDNQVTKNQKFHGHKHSSVSEIIKAI